MNKLLYRSKRFLDRNAPTILTCVGGAGVIFTTVTAVKATPKALVLLENAEEEKGSKLTKLEVVKTAGPVYIPTIIIGASTIAAIFGANALNKHQRAALMSAYALLDNSYKEYKNKVAELYGDDVDDRIKKEITMDNYESDISISDGKRLFFDYQSLRYFESTMEDVISAEYYLNRNLANNGYTSLNDFYQLLGIPCTNLTEDLGWSSDSGEMIFGAIWIDFEHEMVTMDDGLECCIISMSNPPSLHY